MPALTSVPSSVMLNNMGAPRGTVEERFWRFVAKTDGCWNWIGSIDEHGYGLLRVKNGHLSAHRVSYFIHKGPILKPLTIDHLCRNHCCVNPDHLEAVTLVENIKRGLGAGVINARKTHCPKGHPYSKENTYIWRYSLQKELTRRVCKVCYLRQKAKMRRAKACPSSNPL